MSSTKVSRRMMRAQLKREAWDALAIVSAHEDPKPVTVTARNDIAQVTLSVGPPGKDVLPTDQRPGLFLSPRESQIVSTLAVGQTLKAQQISTRTGIKFDGTLKALLRNLCDRKIVDYVKAEGGYRLRPAA